jgi:outer membrane protein, heavy metal efflux system
MSLVRIMQLCALLAALSVGCRATSKPLATSHEGSPVGIIAHSPQTNAMPTPVHSAAFLQELPTPDEAVELPSGPADEMELSLPLLVAKVRDRNPSLQAMAAAWRAAAQRYPQAISLEDPMFMGMMAPDAFDSAEVDNGYALQASQKIPWCGKRAARGRQARAEAGAAYHEWQDSRVRLDEVTRTAFYEYYLTHRQLELNNENLRVLSQFGETAKSKYAANQVTQQDVLQAEVELADLERRNIELERMRNVATARINTLLRQDPTFPLPPPPRELDLPIDGLDAALLQSLAASQRSDLAAAAARVRATQAAVTIACKDYYPDTEVFGKYDAFWQETPLQAAVGVNLNVPIYRDRLRAAVCEAQFTLSQSRAEYNQLLLDIHYEVAAAYERAEESRRVWQLYTDRLVPAAEQNVTAARSNYDVAKSSFLDLAIAQRQLVDLREMREEALTQYHSRLAELTRAMGGSIPTVIGEEVPSSVQP